MTYPTPPTAAEHARSLRIRAVGQALLYASLGMLALCMVTASATWFWAKSRGGMDDLAKIARGGGLLSPKEALGDSFGDYFDVPEKAETEHDRAKADRERQEAVAKLREEVKRTDPRIIRIQELKSRIEKWKIEKAGQQATEDRVPSYKRDGG